MEENLNNSENAVNEVTGDVAQEPVAAPQEPQIQESQPVQEEYNPADDTRPQIDTTLPEDNPAPVKPAVSIGSFKTSKSNKPSPLEAVFPGGESPQPAIEETGDDVNEFDDEFMFNSGGANIPSSSVGGNMVKVIIMVVVFVAIAGGGYFMLMGDDSQPTTQSVDEAVVNELPKMLTADDDEYIDDVPDIPSAASDMEVSLSDWMSVEILPVSSKLTPNAQQPSMEFSTINYKELFASREILVEQIPQQISFINVQGDVKATSVGGASLFVVDGSQDNTKLRLNMLYLNLNKYVVVGDEFAYIALDAVLDNAGNNILGDKTKNYQPAIKDKRYVDSTNESLFSSYEIGLKGDTVKNLSKINGRVKFKFPKNVEVVDFLITDVGNSKKTSSGQEITLKELSQFDVRLSYGFSAKNILQVLVYDRQGQEIKAFGKNQAEGATELFLDQSDYSPAIVRVILAEEFSVQEYPFELAL